MIAESWNGQACYKCLAGVSLVMIHLHTLHPVSGLFVISSLQLQRHLNRHVSWLSCQASCGSTVGLKVEEHKRMDRDVSAKTDQLTGRLRVDSKQAPSKPMALNTHLIKTQCRTK